MENPFLLFLIIYICGAIFIQAFCVSVLVRIPLIDTFAFAIRNILCVIWLIISVVLTFFCSTGNK